MLLLLCGAAVLSEASADSSIVVGNFRVQALSSKLIRVEPRGPMGFEDRTTFTVAGDRTKFGGVAITKQNETAEGTILSTEFYDILLKGTSPTPAPPSCSAIGKTGTDVSAPIRSVKFSNGVKADDRAECCQLCDGDSSCTAYVFAGKDKQEPGINSNDVPGANCWPLASFGTTVGANGREFGCSSRGCKSVGIPPVVVTDKGGRVLYDSAKDTNSAPSMLHWPSPGNSSTHPQAYALMDYPRFFAPEWGAMPIPAGAKVDPALKETNGYDFRNNVEGDTYIFLLGSSSDSIPVAGSEVPASLNGWYESRMDLIRLTGPCPVLPDFAFGTWFTWWHSYSETEAKSDIDRWEKDQLPIDVWALDMNWRNTSNSQDHFYNHPNTNLFPDFSEWFQYLKGKKLRTYFNDHPFPVASRGAGGLQTSPEEIAFRWNGLSEWMGRGLTYWWFDHNWGFSIPPPFVNTSHTDGIWDTLDNAAWGSHVYYSSVASYDSSVRDEAGDTWYGGRPMTLTKFARPDWRPGMPATQHAEHPSQHRYPVWWTGDGVDLQASMESMVDSGLHDFKTYVHSDCGGDYRPKEGGDLVRWAAHCTFGTILRFHGNDHRPWSYDQTTEDSIKSYLTMRYKLVPSLIAAGHVAAETSFPIVARGDMFWPEHSEAATNQQYVHLNDTLVAPIWDSKKSQTSRSVWIPPGDWQDGWSGETVTGPKTITVTQPYEKIPLWHKKGGLVVTTDQPGMRVDDQDWNTLTLQAFPHTTSATTHRHVYGLGDGAHTDIFMTTTNNNNNNTKRVRFDISVSDDGTTRAWSIRLHLASNERLVTAAVDGLLLTDLVHLQPLPTDLADTYEPFGATGTRPSSLAGPIAEVYATQGAHARVVEVEIEKS